MLPEIQLMRPYWLLTLIPLTFLLWRLVSNPRGADAWRGLVDAHLIAHLLVDDGSRVRRLPLVLLALGWLLGVLALAGPVWERLPQPVYLTEARRVIVLDISASMNVADVSPSRLSRARYEVLDMLGRASEGQTALLAFGAEPFIVSPLTSDSATIAAQVPNLETDLMPTRGAARADLALEEAGELLRNAGSPDGEIILVTDGIERPAAAGAVAARLLTEGFRLSVLGVGTERGGPVPLPDGGFLTDGQGAISLPRLKPDRLRSLARSGGGRYVTAVADDTDAAILVPEQGGRVSGGMSEDDARSDQWREEGPWLLLALLPLAALGFRRGWLSPLALVMLVAPHPQARAFDWDDLWQRPDQQAAQAFSAGEHAEAATGFQRPDWRAAAQYASGDYTGTLETLSSVEGPDGGYNRGNALARVGEYQDAIAEYEQLLADDPEHEDARYNRNLLQKLLEQQQPQPDQDQPRDGQQDPDDQQGQDGQRGQSQDEGQNQDDGKQQDSSQGGGGQRNQDDRKPQGGQQGQGEGQDRNQRDSGAQGDQPEQDQGRQGEADGDEGQDQTPAEQGGQGEAEDRQQAGTADGEDESAGDRDPDAPRNAGNRPADDGHEGQSGAAPDRQDLMGGPPAENSERALPRARAGEENREDLQAMENMLRRVPDDPGGLLRQRFLLQHLRRNGQLP